MADILIIDCAGPQMLVARRRDGAPSQEFRSSALRGQAEQLNQAIDQLSVDHPLSALTKIVVNRGPGSFTGIRVALSTAYGLARGLGNAALLHPINAFAVHRLGRGQPEATVILESRRPEKYILKDDSAFVAEPESLTLDGSPTALTDIQAFCGQADPALLSVDDYLRAITAHQPEPLEALYVRPPDVGPQPLKPPQSLKAA